jgi:hypothetical protein
MQATRAFTEWTALPTAAESHGVAPLVYHHLKTTGASIPTDTRRELAALTVRHRHAHEVRTRALRDILSAFEAAGIRTVILKGAALAHLVYPEPGMRPMRDLDLFILDGKAEASLQIMSQLNGFAPDLTEEPNDKHLLGTLLREQLRVSVELHLRVPGTKGEDPIPFSIGPEDSPPAYILNREEMLRHLCHHAAGHSIVFEMVRLIWASDIVGFAEQFADDLDWQALRHERDPNPVGMLSLLDSLIPLSDRLKERAGIEAIRPITCDGIAFEGWPRYSLAQQRDKGTWRILHDTFLPPEWWLRLNHGLGSTDPLFWHRWVRHPLKIAKWVTQLVKERVDRKMK